MQNLTLADEGAKATKAAAPKGPQMTGEQCNTWQVSGSTPADNMVQDKMGLCQEGFRSAFDGDTVFENNNSIKAAPQEPADARWRDIFPLQPIPESRAKVCSDHGTHHPRHSVGAKRRGATRLFNLKCANEVIAASNLLYGSSNAASVCDHVPSLAQRQAQNSVLRSITKNVIPKSSKSKLEAATELLHLGHGYLDKAMEPTTVRSYRKADVSIPKPGSKIPLALEVLDNVGREILSAHERTMLADEVEVGELFESEKPVKPYMDEVLRGDSSMYLHFVVELFCSNMIVFRNNAISIVTPFFVAKKMANCIWYWTAGLLTSCLNHHLT